jgi:hypothetical protein
MTRLPHLHTPLTCAVVTALLAVVCLGLAAVTAAPAAAGPYANPSPAEIRGLLNAAAVGRDIPPKIVYAIAFQESTWRQFDAGGDPLIGSDGKGIGIMQVTTIPDGVDVDRLRTDIAYNIAVGTDILIEKWGYGAAGAIPLIGDGDRRCYEDWFYAVWAYNGWTRTNPYPYRVWEHVRTGPQGWWTGVAVTSVPKTRLVNGLGITIATPQPEHWWSPTPLPKPKLSAPRVQKRVAAGARFSVSGTLSPQHPAGAHSVELRLSRWSGSRWVLRRTVLTTNRDAGAATRWAVTFSLARTGRWKLVASALPDADHSAATSRAAFVTVVR